MTFATLRQLHAIIGVAIDDIERVYQRPPPSRSDPAYPPSPASPASNSPSPSPSPSLSSQHDSGSENGDREVDAQTPPTPTSITFAPSSRARPRRERANTLPPISTSLPPPILKQPPAPPLDFPALDAPYFPLASAPANPSSGGYARASKEARQRAWQKKCEDLMTNADVINAVNRIVAACGQLSANVQKPFLTLCDAAMGYHLPSCLRFLEASHIVEILRDAGPDGLHVREIATAIMRRKCKSSLRLDEELGDIDPTKLSHILRLLATHHITRELRPDVFTNNRISSCLDSGKTLEQIMKAPENKYENTDGFAAFVGLCTDELFKASAYLTDCYLPSTLTSAMPASAPPPPPPPPTPRTPFRGHPNDPTTPTSIPRGVHIPDRSTTPTPLSASSSTISLASCRSGYDPQSSPKTPKSQPRTPNLRIGSPRWPAHANPSKCATDITPTHSPVLRRTKPIANGSSKSSQILGPAFDYSPPFSLQSSFVSPSTNSPRHRRGFMGRKAHEYAPAPSPRVISSPSPLWHSSSPPSPPCRHAPSLSSSTFTSPSPSTYSGSTSHSKKPSEFGLGTLKPMHAPFNLAFRTEMPYFEWLEKPEHAVRLKRFGRAMTGTSGWELPGAIIGALPWQDLDPLSIVVDVGGGIGSTSMLLANAFPHLRFVIQDRPQVVKMGEAAWLARCPEMLDAGIAAFQTHDFFTPQPPLPAKLSLFGTSDSGSLEVLTSQIPAVFLLRVITHDWPDEYVTMILLHLRQSAGPDTKLLLADYILPLACVDEDEPDTGDGYAASHSEALLGHVKTLAPEGSPLLPNLGKANANAYWLDLTMRVMFNAQERTLRELAALTLTAGWKVVQVTRSEGSLFGHIIAVPVDIPPESLALLSPPEPELDAESEVGVRIRRDRRSMLLDVRGPPPGDTFFTQVDLPSEDTMRASAAKRKGLGFGAMMSLHASGRGKANKRPTTRERAYTVSTPRELPPAGDNAAIDGTGNQQGVGEVKKGWRTLVRMLSKPQLRGDVEGSKSGRSR